jgi:hypothetical protein
MDNELLLLTLIAASAVHRARRSRERTRLFRTVSTPFTVNAFNQEAYAHLFRFDHDFIALLASRVLPCTLLRLEIDVLSQELKQCAFFCTDSAIQIGSRLWRDCLGVSLLFCLALYTQW